MESTGSPINCTNQQSKKFNFLFHLESLGGITKKLEVIMNFKIKVERTFIK